MPKKTWRKSLNRTEKWKIGRVKVTRNNKGRFVSWHKIRQYRRGVTAQGRWKTGVARARWNIRVTRRLRFGGKRVAVYGTTVNKKGVRQKNRIELYGSGRELYGAVKKFHSGFVPREPYTVMNAEDLSGDDVERGEWLYIEVES